MMISPCQLERPAADSRTLGARIPCDGRGGSVHDAQPPPEGVRHSPIPPILDSLALQLPVRRWFGEPPTLWLWCRGRRVLRALLRPPLVPLPLALAFGVDGRERLGEFALGRARANVLHDRIHVPDLAGRRGRHQTHPDHLAALE